MQIFAAITKVDEQTGKVYGRAVQEVVDRAGEIFDYASSKPHFAHWSEGFAKVTDGKSVGNVRAMHGKIAAGKLTEITFNDAEKAIDVCAEIVDPLEREKCLKGIYTGFSIGGRYEKKWADQDNQGVTRYTAQPSEISLVDLPCVPTAQFTVTKSDGTSEMRKFAVSVDDAEALAKWVEALPDEARDTLAKIAERKDVSPKEGADKYGDVTFADPENKKYPIDTAEHIRAAWNYIHKGENAEKYSAADADAIKSRIVAAWKDKIDPKGPPEAEKMATETETPVEKSAEVAPEAVQAADADQAAPDLAKAGARHSAKDKAHLAAIAEAHQAASKHLAAMGEHLGALNAPGSEQADAASGGGDDEAPAQKLAKAADDMQKLTAERDQLAKRVAELEALPAPAKGVVKAVEKTLGGEPDKESTVLRADGSTDHVAMVEKTMRDALRKPIRVTHW